MNAYRVVKVRFSGAHFDSDGVALSHFTGIWSEVVKTDNSELFSFVAHQLEGEAEG